MESNGCEGSAFNTQTAQDPNLMANLKKLSRVNGEINQMTVEELSMKLHGLQLNTRGTKEVLKKRLKDYYKRQKLASKYQSEGNVRFDFLCIIDFEATCEAENPPNFPHEIIEFPAVLLCTHNFQVVKEFHRYCKPVKIPKLSTFCKSLTGITQEDVDTAEHFPHVLEAFFQWIQQSELGSKYSFAIVTDGPWDMQNFLNKQCELSGIKFPRFARKWINVRKIFSNFYDCKRMSLIQMLEKLGLAFEGRQHCGLDDARNITRIVVQLLKDGATLKINDWLMTNEQIAKRSNNSTKKRLTNKAASHKVTQAKGSESREPKSLQVVTDSDLGADPQIDLEDLRELVSYRSSKLPS